MNSKLFIAPIAIHWLLTLSGCSIMMALNGTHEPNFDVIKVGAAREEVEFELGKPASSQEMSDGKKVDSYKYEVGNSPNPGRASIYGYYDLITIGLAEPIFTIVELVQGDDEETQIVYGPDDRVLEIHGYTPPPVSAELKAAEEAQEQYKRKRPTPKTTASEPPSPESK